MLLAPDSLGISQMLHAGVDPDWVQRYGCIPHFHCCPAAVTAVLPAMGCGCTHAAMCEPWIEEKLRGRDPGLSCTF